MKDQPIYIDSSEEDTQQKRKIKKGKNKSTKCLNVNRSENGFEMMRQIIKQNIDKQLIKNLLLIDDGEKEIISSLYMRSQKYNNLIRDLDVDNKYARIMAEKVAQLHKNNQDKRHKYLINKQKQKLSFQKAQISKLIIQKNLQKQNITRRLKNKVRLIGFDKAYTSHKLLKESIQNNQKLYRNQIDSLNNKQNNQIKQLKEILFSLQKDKKLAKTQQNKLLRSYRDEIAEMKNKVRQIHAAKWSAKGQFRV